MIEQNKPYYDFAVGPSTLHPDVSSWMQTFVEEGWGSCSHRSPRFNGLYFDMEEKLRELLGLPEDYYILISDSGSTIMEKLLQGLVREQTFHFVMGGFSQKQKTYAQRLGLQAQETVVDSGKSFYTPPSTIYPSTELICLTHCETSSGVKLSNTFLQELRAKYPDIPMSLDMVSTAPFTDLDLSQFESMFFSCQKLFGLPAGLGIWIIRKDLASMGANDINGGAHQRLSEYIENYNQLETVSTPNVLGVFLLEKVLTDFLKRGKSNIIQQLEHRKQALTEAIDQSPFVHNHVKDIADQSDSIFVADYIDSSVELRKLLKDNRLATSHGYQAAKYTQIRIANFPAIPDEAYEKLCKVLKG